MRVEPLEDRRLLDAGGHSIELLETSPALFVENRGQWDNGEVEESRGRETHQEDFGDDPFGAFHAPYELGDLVGDGAVEGYQAAVTWFGSFGPPEALHTNAGADSGDDSFPQVTTDGAGNWGAVWIPQGPAPAINGQVENAVPDNEVSGAIHTVIAHPTDPDVLWSGSVNGGIWRTDNATAASPTWWPQTDNLESLSIGAMALDPTDPTNNTLVAGLGRTSSFGRRGDDAGRIFRTTDGGTNWSDPGSSGLDNPSIGERISGIAARGSMIVVSSTEYRGGIFRSTDGGANFAAISAADFVSPNDDFFDLVEDPTDPAGLRLYAAGANKGIYRSDDFGASWVKITGPAINAEMDTILTDSRNNNTEMAVSPVNGRLFVAAVLSGRVEGIFYSDDPTASSPTWARMDTPVLPAASPLTVTGATNTSPIEITTSTSHGMGSGYRVVIADVTGNTAANGNWRIAWTSSTTFTLDFSEGNGDYLSGGTATPVVGAGPTGEKPGAQGYLHLSILADSADADMIYLGGDRQDIFTNTIGARDYTGSLYRGNAGIPRDPTQIPSPQWDHLTHDVVPFDPEGGTASGSAPHADSREMVFDANGNIIEVDDGGIYRRTSPRDNTGDWFSMNGNLQVAEQHDVAYDTISNIIISGNQDTGTTQQQSPGSLTWDSIHTGDGGDVAVSVDPTNPAQSVRYSSYQRLDGFRRRVYDASNNIVSQTFLPGISHRWFLIQIAVNAVDPNRIVIGAADAIYESFDQGSSKAPIAGSPSTDNPLAYGHQDNPDLLATVGSGTVYVRTSGSMAPTPTAFPESPRDVIFDPGAGQANRFFVIGSAFISPIVFTTPDAGTTWIDITGNLGLLANDLKRIEYVEGTPNDALVVASNNGVFFSDSSTGFAVWDELGAGLPNGLAYDLEYDPVDDVLVVGTLGRGAWLLPNVSELVNAAKSDFGDAPDSYGTTLASSGARHTAIGPVLGSALDTESDAGMPLDGTGDNINGTTNDEDGVLIFTPFSVGAATSLTVNVSNGPALLNAWIDYNGNGQFDTAAGEQIAADLSVNSGPNSVDFVVPSGATAGATFARFRLSTSGGIGPTGAAYDGEVEDYAVTIVVGDVPPVVIDRVRTPDATIDTAVVDIDVTFSEVVQGVDSTDLVLTGGAAIAASVGTPTDQGANTWRFPVTGLGNGALYVSLAPDANDIQDLAGNDLVNLTWSYPVALTVTSQIVASVDGYATDSGLDGTFETIDTTGTGISSRKLAASGEDRGLMEFDISGVSPTDTVLSAELQFRISSSWYDTLFEVYGYAGDGAVTTADAEVTAPRVGTAEFARQHPTTASLDPAFIQSLLGSSDFVGLRTQIGALEDRWGVFYSIDATYRPVSDYPTLILETTAGNDTTPPTVIDRVPAPDATISTSNVDIDVTFSEQVLVVDSTDLVLTGPAAASASVGAPTGQGANTWRFPVTGLVDGAMTVSLAPDANDIEDLAGNDLANLQWNYTVALGQISGGLWNDLDGDGFRDTGEFGLAGWTIELDLGLDGTWDLSEVTGADGAYTFTGLAAGEYGVREQPQAGWGQTYPNAMEYLPQGARDIRTVGGSLLADGDTFLVGDGSSNVTFEFDTGDGVAPANVVIPFSPADTAEDIASALQAAINNVPGFGVSAATSGDVVTLSGPALNLVLPPGSPLTDITSHGNADHTFTVYIEIGEIFMGANFGNGPAFDFGDAPDTYGTTAAADGARHLPTGPTLGANRDSETDGQPTAAADGDDTTGTPDDEDGVTIPPMSVGAAPSVNVTVTNNTGSTATLYGWIDYNGNGAFELGERASIAVPNGSSGVAVTLVFPAVPWLSPAVTNTYARFRLSTDTAAANPTGAASDGEVEDDTAVIQYATIANREIFYNNSSFDGNDPAANPNDDGAIAPDKTPLLPGQTATFANYTSYHRGINGIMVDIQDLAVPAEIDAADFIFAVRNDNEPGVWPEAPAPTSVSVRAGAGVGGSDRVTIIWADNTIGQEWLQVTVVANAHTGLLQNDVFYFGNSIGENTGDFLVNYSDAFDLIWPLLFTPDPIGVDHAGDVNRDGRIDYGDVFDAVWPNLFGPPLVELTPPAAPAPLLQSTGSVFDENRPWAVELMWFDELYGSSGNSEEEEDDPLEATAVDGVFSVYYEE